jgi:hypothetical protein
MQCAECGATFIQYKSDQRFCCDAHSSRHRQRLFRSKQRAVEQAALQSSSDVDQLRQENEALQKNIRYEQERFENMKDVIKKHDDIVDKMIIEIDRQKEELKEKDVIIGNRNSEIE